jgi:hypothetical protein
MGYENREQQRDVVDPAELAEEDDRDGEHSQAQDEPNITPAINALSEMRIVDVMINAAARKLTTTKPIPMAEEATPPHPQPIAAATRRTGAIGIARRARSPATCNSGAGPATGCDRASLNTIGHLSQSEPLLVTLHVGDVAMYIFQIM